MASSAAFYHSTHRYVVQYCHRGEHWSTCNGCFPYILTDIQTRPQQQSYTQHDLLMHDLKGEAKGLMLFRLNICKTTPDNQEGPNRSVWVLTHPVEFRKRFHKSLLLPGQTGFRGRFEESQWKTGAAIKQSFYFISVLSLFLSKRNFFTW